MGFKLAVKNLDGMERRMADNESRKWAIVAAVASLAAALAIPIGILFGTAIFVVATGPVECGFEHNLLGRVTLRFVKSGRRFWNPEDVRYAVIADAVARTKVSVSVVVERAPSETTGVFVARRQLVVDAGVPMGVFANSLDVVGSFGRVHVARKLGVEIERMIWRPKRKAKVVHRKHILQKLRAIPVTHAARRPRIVQLVRQLVGPCIEIMIVAGLIDANAPQDD